MSLGSARRALQPSARRGAGALWSCAPGRVREAPCRPRRVRIGVDNGSLGWAAGHWGSQFAYPNGWFPAPMRLACSDADRRAREGSAGGQSACRRPTALSRGGGARGALHPFPNLPPPGPSGVGAAVRAQGIGWRMRRREGAPSTSLQWVRPLGLARCCVGWSWSLCAQPGVARKGGAPSATVPAVVGAALQRLGVVGRVVWFRFFVRVVVGRGCVWCVVGVCAASRSALRDPPAVAALSAPCCGIRPRLRRLARHCAT